MPLVADDPLIPDFLKAYPPSGFTVTAHSHHDTYEAISPLNIDLAGKSVFITGSSRSIGRAIAVSYARAGASFIALAARGSLDDTVAAVKAAAAAAKRPEPTVLPLKVDTSDQASVEAAAAATAAALQGKPLDIVVNNAGALEAVVPFGESKPADWWYSFEVNVKGVYLVCHALLPLLLAAGPDGQAPGDRTIVNIASIGALLVMPGLSGYGPSKTAVLRLTEFLAAEYADQKLVALAVHPGGVQTTMTAQLPPEMAAGAVDQPELVADSITYLTRKPLHWLSGRYISSNWDQPELEAREAEIVAKDLLKNRLAA